MSAQWDGGTPFRHDYGPKGCCGDKAALGVDAALAVVVLGVRRAVKAVRR